MQFELKLELSKQNPILIKNNTLRKTVIVIVFHLFALFL